MIITHTDNCNINGVIIGWHYEYDSVFTNLLDQLDVIGLLSKLNHPSISGNLYLLHKLTSIERCYCQRFRKKDYMEQPHYLILTDNNEICYVKQSININSIVLFVIITYLYDIKFINFILDTISKCSTNKRSKLINNAEIGRYFTRFEGTHYVPNENLAKLYPDDAAAILEILSSQ